MQAELARSRAAAVRVRGTYAESSPQQVVERIVGVVARTEDDGHRLDIGVEQALLRGGRLDEADGKHDGIGLTMVRDLAEATDGQITLLQSPLGGLLVSINWAATVAP